MSIDIEHIRKTYGTFEALQDVSLRIEKGELVALLGPSGSGKTTLLRIIAGLDIPDSGTIRLNDEDATSSTARERQVGFVFQHYALFRHLTVFENVAFGLRLRPKTTRPSEQDIRDRVKKLLELIQLDWLGDRYPNQLSGGQRQRVAPCASSGSRAARVAARRTLRCAGREGSQGTLRCWLRRLHDELHVASVFVTHDQEEALEVADRVAIMNRGQIEQVGTPIEVYDNPSSAFVYHFLGDVNLFHGRGEVAETAGYVRPYELDVARHPGGSPEAVVASIRYIASAGPVVRLELKRDDNGSSLDAEISRERYRELELRVGDKVDVTPRNVRTFTT